MDLHANDARLREAGDIVETVARWALPSSPLFLMILMLLAHAPYAAPIVDPSAFYLTCMCGATVGLIFLTFARLKMRGRIAACVTGGVVLEAAWLVLLAAERIVSAPLLLLGSTLAGLGSSILLVLWLWAGQTDSPLCEVAKLAGAFGVTYVLYTLFTVIPHAGVVTYLFPPLTCVFLCMAIPKENAEEGEYAAGIDAGVPNRAPESRPAPSLPQTIGVTCLLVSFGAGFAALGFGGAQVEQGAGLLTLVLAICLLFFSGEADFLRIVAVPTVVFSLCYAGLAGAGNAFAFFLMGCGSLVIWLFQQHRFGWGEPYRTSVQDVAQRLAFIALAAGVGMAAGTFGFRSMGVASADQDLVLIAVVILASLFWQVMDLHRTNAQVSTLPAGQAGTDGKTASDEGVAGTSEASWAAGAAGTIGAAGTTPAAATIAVPSSDEFCRLFALSPREAQVAQLLCQNRSVQYISRTLGMADSTTKTHVRHVYEKAGVHSRTELQLETERLSKTRSN